jgi:hypothetical protein
MFLLYTCSLVRESKFVQASLPWILKTTHIVLDNHMQLKQTVFNFFLPTGP